LLIAGLAVIYQTFNYILPEKEGELSPIDFVVLVAVVVCAISSFLVSNRYARSTVFGQAYLALGIGFTAYAIGELKPVKDNGNRTDGKRANKKLQIGRKK